MFTLRKFATFNNLAMKTNHIDSHSCEERLPFCGIIVTVIVKDVRFDDFTFKGDRFSSSIYCHIYVTSKQKNFATNGIYDYS